jgi:hypothetical protein
VSNNDGTRITIEQLVDVLAGRGDPQATERIRRELSEPDSEPAQFLEAMRTDDTLAVDWSRLDEPRSPSGLSSRDVTPGQTRRLLGRFLPRIAAATAIASAIAAFMTSSSAVRSPQPSVPTSEGVQSMSAGQSLRSSPNGPAAVGRHLTISEHPDLEVRKRFSGLQLRAEPCIWNEP